VSKPESGLLGHLDKVAGAEAVIAAVTFSTQPQCGRTEQKVWVFLFVMSALCTRRLG
jgi:hypothetical protein